MWLDCDIWRFLSVMVIKRLSTHFNTLLVRFKVHIRDQRYKFWIFQNLNVNLWYVFRPRWELAVSLSRVCNEPVYQVKSPTENLRPSVLPRPTQSGQYRTFVIATFSFFHLEISWKLSKGWTHCPAPISWPTCSLSSSSQGETTRNWSKTSFFSPNPHDLNTIWGWMESFFQFKNVRLSSPVDLLSMIWTLDNKQAGPILCWECWYNVG